MTAYAHARLVVDVAGQSASRLAYSALQCSLVARGLALVRTQYAEHKVHVVHAEHGCCVTI